MPVNLSRYINVAFLIICTVFYLSLLITNKKILITNIIIIIVTVLVILISLIFSDFGFYDLLIVTWNILLATILYKNVLSLKSYYLKFYIFCTIFLTLYFFYYLFNVNIFNQVNYFHLYSSWDKNYSAVIIFLYMCLSIKINRKYGFALGILYTIILNSRMLQLCSIVAILIYFFDRRNTSACKELHKPLIKKPSTIIYFLSILTIALSYYMTFNIDTRIISSYQETLYDKSNAIRVRANVYAIKNIINNPMHIIYGYDNSIKKQLNVEDENTAAIYQGYRLVQPHNFLLNFILRYGLVYAIIYLLILDKILLPHLDKENRFVIYPYLIMNMIMHSLLSTGLLIFFIYVLAYKENKNHEQ